MLPVLCHACGHRFRRTAVKVLADPTCPQCSSEDLDFDSGRSAALDATAIAKRAGHKRAAMVRDVMATNSSLTRRQAKALADEALARYPVVEGQR